MKHYENFINLTVLSENTYIYLFVFVHILKDKEEKN